MKSSPIQVLDSPSLDQLLADTYPHFPFEKTFLQARHEPLVVVHTSGTTAVPKPIVYTHDFAASYVQWAQLEPPPGFEMQVSLCQSNRLFVTLPFFHVSYRRARCPIANRAKAGNLFATLFEAIANQTIVITPLAGVMPSAQSVVDGLKRVRADALFLAPHFLEQIAKSQEMVDSVTKNVEIVTYAGGDVPQWSGDILTGKTKLFNFNGSTETGVLPSLKPKEHYPSEDWKYIHPHPAAGIDFRPSVRGLFEAIIIRNPVFEDEQPIFKLFPDLREYPTRDLWVPHPFKEGLWTYSGRADDIIVFKPGYMCDPIPMEQLVSRHPQVQAALMIGTGRSQPAMIIERTLDHDLPQAEEQELTEALWPIIEEANQKYKLGTRVSRSHIMYTSLQQPMRRAGKGTVQRGPTVQLYKNELDALYAREGDLLLENELVLPRQENEVS